MSDKKNRRSSIAFTRQDGTVVAVPVPDDPAGEAQALGAGLEALVQSGEWKPDDGEPMAAEAFYQELGYTPPAQGKRKGTSTDRQPSKGRAGAKATSA